MKRTKGKSYLFFYTKESLNIFLAMLRQIKKGKCVKKKTSIIISILGALGLIVGGLLYMDIIKITKKIPTPIEEVFQFKTSEGKTLTIKAGNRSFHIEGMENKIVFFKIFGWDCEFCQKEIPQLVNLKKRLPNTFDVIAIEAQDHTKEQSQKFIKEYGINYDIVSGEDYRDFYTYLQKQYGWTGVIPLTIVLSKDGYVLAFELGSKSYSLAELFKASIVKK
jgi:thiol-disulfide isomerase/thioredoxin